MVSLTKIRMSLNGKQEVLDEHHTKTIRWVSFSPNGSNFATASFDSEVCVWSIGPKGISLLTALEGHETEVTSTDFLTNSSMEHKFK